MGNKVHAVISLMYGMGNITILTRDSEYRLFNKDREYIALLNGVEVARADCGEREWVCLPGVEKWEWVLNQMCQEVEWTAWQHLLPSVEERFTMLLHYLWGLLFWPQIEVVKDGVLFTVRGQDGESLTLTYRGLVVAAAHREQNMMWWYADLPAVQLVLGEIARTGYWDEYVKFVGQIILAQARNILDAWGVPEGGRDSCA